MSEAVMGVKTRKTHLINEQLWNGLLVNFNGVAFKELLSAVSLVGIQPSAHDLGIGPRRIFPASNQGELVLNGVVEKS